MKMSLPEPLCNKPVDLHHLAYFPNMTEKIFRKCCATIRVSES